MSNPFLSVVIPAYQESLRIPKTLEQIYKYLNRQDYTFEIIVVDDGSKDGTSDIAKEVLDSKICTILKNEGNRGKGYSVRRGVLEAKGEYVLFSDADLSTPISELEKMLPHLKSDYDIVIGSRALVDRSCERDMLWYREIMGRVYNAFGQLLLFPGVMDSQCGFKCFTNAAAKTIFSKQLVNGFSFDGEILFLANKQNYRIKELPVNWYNTAQSKVRVVRDSMKMFLDLIYIRWIHRRTRSGEMEKRGRES